MRRSALRWLHLLAASSTPHNAPQHTRLTQIQALLLEWTGHASGLDVARPMAKVAESTNETVVRRFGSSGSADSKGHVVAMARSSSDVGVTSDDCAAASVAAAAQQVGPRAEDVASLMLPPRLKRYKLNVPPATDAFREALPPSSSARGAVKAEATPLPSRLPPSRRNLKNSSRAALPPPRPSEGLQDVAGRTALPHPSPPRPPRPPATAQPPVALPPAATRSTTSHTELPHTGTSNRPPSDQASSSSAPPGGASSGAPGPVGPGLFAAGAPGGGGGGGCSGGAAAVAQRGGMRITGGPYSSLAVMMDELKAGGLPPAPVKLVALLEAWKALTGAKSQAETKGRLSGRDLRLGRMLTELDRLLAPHIRGAYGQSLPPEGLTRLLWMWTRNGHLGASSVALVDQLAARVTPGMALTPADYWPTLTFWALGRAEQIARASGGGSAAGAGGSARGRFAAAADGAESGGSESLDGGGAGAAAAAAVVEAPGQGGPAAVVSRARQLLLQQLVEVVARNAGQLPSQGVSNVFWAAGRLRLRDTAFLAALGARAAELVEEMQPQNISNILYGCATMGLHAGELAATQRPVPFLSRLLDEAVRRGLGSFTPQEMSNLIWASTKMDLDNRQLLAAASELMATTDYVTGYVAQEWANPLYAMALCDFYDPRLMDKFRRVLLGPQAAAAPSTNAHISGPGGSSSSSSSSAGEGSSTGEGSSSESGGSGSAARSQGQQALQPKAPHSPLPPAAAAPDPTTRTAMPVAAGASIHNRRQQQQQQQPLPPSEPPAALGPAAASTASALAAVSPYSQAKLAPATPQACSNILFAMGSLRHLDEQVVDALLARMVTHGSALSGADVTLAARALAQLGYASPVLLPLLETSMPRLRAESHRLMPHNLLWSLMLLGLLPDPRYQPFVRFLVGVINRHGLHGWAAAAAEQGVAEALRSKGLLGGEQGLRRAPQQQQRQQQQQQQQQQDGKAGVDRLDRRIKSLMEDWTQLFMYHLESRQLGLTGPDYDVQLRDLPGGMQRLTELVAQHKREVAEGARALVVQRKVTEALEDLAASGLLPSILRVESEVLLEPELVMVDIVLHLARPGAEAELEALQPPQPQPPQPPTYTAAAAADADTAGSLEGQVGRDTAALPAAAPPAPDNSKSQPYAAAAAAAAAAALDTGADTQAQFQTAVAAAAAAAHDAATTLSEDAAASARDDAVGEQANGATTTASSAPTPRRPTPRLRPVLRWHDRRPPPHLSYLVAVEVDGPMHFLRSHQNRPEGTSLYRDRLLARRLGGPQNVVVVPTRVWVEQLREEGARMAFLQERLAATVPPPPPPAAPEAAAAVAAGMS